MFERRCYAADDDFDDFDYDSHVDTESSGDYSGPDDEEEEMMMEETPVPAPAETAPAAPAAPEAPAAPTPAPEAPPKKPAK